MKQRLKQASVAAVIAAFVLLGGVYARPLIIIEANNLATDNSFADIQLARVNHSKKSKPIPQQTSLETYADLFNDNAELVESSSLTASSSSKWWLSSGAYFYSGGGKGSTVSGELSAANPWRVAYMLSNATDTDNGYHPQNIFRLVTKSAWLNYSQEAYFITTAFNASASTERDAWSGIFFFNRYKDQDNLYYTGVRDDGHVVIKAKKNGVYTTLAEKNYWPGTYNRETNPTLLPTNQSLGLKTEVITNANKTVSIKFYVDENSSGSWKLVLEATDTSNPILNAGYLGIRTDFRDAEFTNYKVVKFPN